MILGCWDEEKFLLLLLISIKGPYTWSPFAWIGVLLRSVSVRNTPRWIYMGRIKTSCSAKMYRESPGTSRVTWIRGDASRILAVYHPSEIKLSHPSEIKSSYPCKQVPCKWWPKISCGDMRLSISTYFKRAELLLPTACLLAHTILASMKAIWIGILLNVYIYMFPFIAVGIWVWYPNTNSWMM